MAKYRRYRNYNRRNRTKWSSNLSDITEVISAPSAATFFHSVVLSFNPTQTNTTVPQIFTVKNVEFNGTIETNTGAGGLENIRAFIMFVPQGMNITASYDHDHPEYIMAMKYFGGPAQDGYQNWQPIRVKTRLSRKLNTGDSIILYIKGHNVAINNDSHIDLTGIVRWWTKAN